MTLVRVIHLFSKLSTHIIIVNIVRVLGRDDNCIDTGWNDFTISQNMFAGDLGLGILNSTYKTWSSFLPVRFKLINVL